MKLLKTMPFTFRIFLLSTCLYACISCKDKASNETKAEVVQTNQDDSSSAKINQTSTEESASNQDKGEAHFVSALKAAEVNNMPLAFKEFLESAKAGHIYGQYNLGLMYEQGLGTTKNAKEAVYWYTESAEQGNSAAQFNLGVCYENGIGTAVDFEKTNAWYRKASIQGDGLAVGNLGMLYIRGQGVKENKVAGIALLLISATIDTSPENRARTNIASTKGLTTAMVTEAQTLSDEMTEANNLLEPLDKYLSRTE
ncbi:tetratricopeptide repeat protein [Tamlana sp. I1]|uniref:tetratricopeptide repeat protein n=1 Tax=Tamlana sp. I1 TaxID=2762061 RepID=UPI001E4534AC|nr:tetratricopeptide repeat protein [Tamlana sp. I1]